MPDQNLVAFNPKQIQEEIIDQYFAKDNNRPWIVGFSGGKDSTMLFQLVWYALKSIPVESRTRKNLCRVQQYIGRKSKNPRIH